MNETIILDETNGNSLKGEYFKELAKEKNIPYCTTSEEVNNNLKDKKEEKEVKKMNKQTKIIIALGVTLIVVFGVIAFNYWNNYQEQKDLEIYNQGINDAVIAIINEVKTNNYVQLPDGNKSIILTQYTGEAQ